MLKICYFLLLMAASVEDYRKHRVSPWWITGVFLLGIINMITLKENRWVTVALTCACILLLYLFYQLILALAQKYGLPWKFGGADVRLIPGMMLVQGWDTALSGVLIGFLLAMGYYLLFVKSKKEIPLVPWMALGCLIIEVVHIMNIIC